MISVDSLIVMKEAEPFMTISSYDLNRIFTKVFTFARDQVYTDERQFSIINVLQDSVSGYINEYALLILIHHLVSMTI